ncbi:hypothetical protein ED312_19825 [Sinomicrobium pectinilyticum]|uniref:DUF2812 domain-containing protein n=1 Tax=Sinomicrobium pectinilyticum TaxID=1084421 RepID=A0A3N0DRC3_SINP1|nr:hypothetical protein [Sinomicrobium pectinilyticum]RNL78051.1 hypothetical protein ED312_19825 [Sinomicrobium pectinilyticum]
MYDQFKADRFDGTTLQALANDLQTAGWEIRVVWKKGAKKRDEYGEGVNFLQLEKNGKWFFRQVRNKGFVRFGNMEKEEEILFLQLLKKYNLYSQPEWGLGIVLSVIYGLLIFFLASSRDEEWMGIGLSIAALCLVSFLTIAYLRSKGEVPEGLYRVSLIFGIAGYVLTALSSLLCLPVMNNIFQNSLYHKVNTAAALP